MADDVKVIRADRVDQVMASEIADQTSLTRAALAAVLPKAGTTVPSGIVTSVQQRSDKTWPAPVRADSDGIRIFRSPDLTGPPNSSYGLRMHDWWVTDTNGIQVATYVPSVGAATWRQIANLGTGSPGTVIPDPDPTDPGTPDPGTPPASSDTSSPSPTSRPYALLGSTGTWTTTGGTTLIQALSDQHITGAKGTPTSSGSGVSLVIDMGNFAHAPGNDLVITLWGTKTSTAGDVRVSVGHQGQTYAASQVRAVTGTAQDLAFRWAPDSHLSLPATQWRDIEVTITKSTGDLEILDLTAQSFPPVEAPGPVDVTDAASLTWGNTAIWTSQVASAPLAKANLATAAYVRAQAGNGAIRLDCYGDAPPIWMVPGTTPRVNVSPPATTSRGSRSLMTTTDGKGALDGVPIPANAVAPANTFRTAVVGCIETNQVWELLGLAKTGTAWTADWGGRIDQVNTSQAAFPAGTGYTGSGLAHAAASVKISEARAAANGVASAVQHAIGINLNYSTASPKWCWPATRSDGTSNDIGAPQMGQRLRLKVNADLSQCTPLGRAIGEAMKKFGAVIMGGADRISVLCESGSVEQARTGTDPWGTILAGRTVDTVLQGLPLDQLEAVSPGWGSSSWVPEADAPVVVVPPPVTPPPSSGQSAAMRILGPTRSGLPWHSGIKADGPYATPQVEGFGSWRGRPVDGGITYPAYQDNMAGIEKSSWTATLYNGFPGRIYYGMAPFATPMKTQAGWDGALWRRLANGEFDQTIDAQANYLVNNGRGNSVIRIAWEWNGDWYAWRCGYNGRAAFKDGFRRIVNRFRAKSSKFVFVFEINAFTSLNGKGGGMAPYEEMYPGDDIVDIVGTDCYQFRGEGAPDGAFSRYLRTRGGFGPGLDDTVDFAKSRGKGVGVFEWGIHGTDGYGDDPTFIQGYWDWFVKHRDIIVAESYFNERGSYIKCSLYDARDGHMQNPRSAAKYKELWGRGVI